LTARFAKLASNTPAAPCASSPAGAVLWDFTGFQMTPYSEPPSETATEPQPYFYEAAHFTPRVGVAVLDRVLGKPVPAPFDQGEFGVELTPATIGARVADERARRDEWLKTDANAQMIEAKLDEWMKTDAAESHGPRDPFSRDDWMALKRDIKAIVAR
jgi:hypothetical protein